jgi:hypothetical protein
MKLACYKNQNVAMVFVADQGFTADVFEDMPEPIFIALRDWLTAPSPSSVAWCIDPSVDEVEAFARLKPQYRGCSLHVLMTRAYVNPRRFRFYTRAKTSVLEYDTVCRGADPSAWKQVIKEQYVDRPRVFSRTLMAPIWVDCGTVLVGGIATKVPYTRVRHCLPDFYTKYEPLRPEHVLSLMNPDIDVSKYGAFPLNWMYRNPLLHDIVVDVRQNRPIGLWKRRTFSLIGPTFCNEPGYVVRSNVTPEFLAASGLPEMVFVPFQPDALNLAMVRSFVQRNPITSDMSAFVRQASRFIGAYKTLWIDAAFIIPVDPITYLDRIRKRNLALWGITAEPDIVRQKLQLICAQYGLLCPDHPAVLDQLYEYFASWVPVHWYVHSTDVESISMVHGRNGHRHVFNNELKAFLWSRRHQRVPMLLPREKEQYLTSAGCVNLPPGLFY